MNGELLSAGLARLGAFRWERRLPRSARWVSLSENRLTTADGYALMRPGLRRRPPEGSGSYTIRPPWRFRPGSGRAHGCIRFLGFGDPGL